MNSLGIIVTGWTVVGLIVVWALVCALVVVRMLYLDERSWHWRLYQYSVRYFAWHYGLVPRHTCAYWGKLFVAPFLVGVMWIPVGILNGVLILVVLISLMVMPAPRKKWVDCMRRDGIKATAAQDLMEINFSVFCLLRDIGRFFLDHYRYDIRAKICREIRFKEIPTKHSRDAE